MHSRSLARRLNRLEDAVARWWPHQKGAFAWRFVTLAGVLLFLLEGGIMLVLHRFPVLERHPGLEALIDATLLAIGGGGALAYFAFLPLQRTLRRAEDAERRAREFARGLQSRQEAIDAAGIVAITDPQGRITHANDAFVRISGYSREELLGRTHRIVNSGYHPPEFFRELYETLQRGRVWRGDIRNRAKDGSIYWVDSTLYPVLDEAGRPVEYIAIRIDITERKRLEEQLREERDRSERQAKREAEFLANMSHEIRTPMNGVLGMAELVLDAELPPEQRARMEVLQSSARSLLTLLDDILDVSKLEAGKLRIEPVPFCPRTLLERVHALLETRAREKGLELQLAGETSLPDRVVGDPTRIQQILLNLAGNAVKFTEKGFVRIEAAREDQELVFQVLDTGIGIDASSQRRLFERFEQADRSTTRRFGGTGLGLAISKQLCELMGGTIGVESAAGRGSTFWFRLPLQTADPESAGTENGPEESTGEVPPGLRALLVEDDRTNQLVARGMLRKLGIEVEIANDGIEALERLGGRRYDLVFMDGQMPGKDGYEATRALRAGAGPNCSTPVIAMTANALPGDREACLAAGMDDYLSKPLSLPAIRAAVGRVLRARSDAPA